MTGTGACRAAEPERPAQAHATAAAALPVRASAHLAVAAPSGTTAAREYRAAEYAALWEAHECPAPAHATAAAALPVYASAQREAVVLTVFSVQRRVPPSPRPLGRPDGFLRFLVVGGCSLSMLKQSGDQRPFLRAENPLVLH